MSRALFILLLVSTAHLSSCGGTQEAPRRESTRTPDLIPITEEQEVQQPRETISLKRIEFSKFTPSFRFSAEIPDTWEVEFVREINAVNIYDPNGPATEVRKQSQIFIRLFEADRFLTLSTVDILQREETTVQGHPAVRYEIEKKAGVADYLAPGNPLGYLGGGHDIALAGYVDRCAW